MGARGKTAGVALLVESLDAAKRPDPPDTLNEEEATEWRRVVGGMPPNWFAPETLALLEQRCHHVIWARTTAALVSGLLEQLQRKQNKTVDDIKAYESLLRQASSQARTLLQLDTAMRLTQQSTYEKNKRKGTGANRSAKIDPWSDEAAA